MVQNTHRGTTYPMPLTTFQLRPFANPQLECYQLACNTHASRGESFGKHEHTAVADSHTTTVNTLQGTRERTYGACLPEKSGSTPFVNPNVMMVLPSAVPHTST